MKYIYFLCVVQLFLTLNACQSNESTNQANAKPLFINYEVRYLEKENELRGMAHFKEGDSPETAVPREVSNPTFQGSSMDKQDLGEKGIRYVFKRKGSYSDNFEFGYKNDNGTPISYSISMPLVNDFSIKEDTIYKSKGATFLWSGEPFDSTQSIIIMFLGEDKNATSISLRGPSEGQEIGIPTTSFNGLSPGKGEMYFVKKQVRESKENNQAIRSTVEYYSRSVNIFAAE